MGNSKQNEILNNNNNEEEGYIKKEQSLLTSDIAKNHDYMNLVFSKIDSQIYDIFN